jgi:EAL domain-containing protein (putative c-di-GMP-specific phosphodiesterase class I)
VVAECVESQAQLDLLRAHGCQQAQGFRIARPMPAGAMALMWAEHSAHGAEAATFATPSAEAWPRV